MSRRTKSHDINQQSLFGSQVSIADFQIEMKECLNRVTRDCTRDSATESRYTLAGRISHRLQREITESMFSNYLSIGKEDYHPHNDFIMAFCLETGSIKPLQLMAKYLGVGVLGREEMIYAELARIQKSREDLERKEKELRARLK